MKVPENEINEQSSSQDIVGWDSLSYLSLVIELQREFDVEFSDEQLIEMTSVKSIMAVLHELCKNA